MQSRTRKKYIKSDNLGTMNESFHFEVSPARQCAGWYMYTSDPEMSALCGSLSKCQIASQNCGAGFTGWPKTFNYTPESNSKYVNEQCSKCQDKIDIPCANIVSKAPGIL